MANELTDLRDIHLPPAIEWWPPAPGYFLLVFCLMLLALAGFWFHRRHRQTEMKRRALKDLTQLEREYALHLDVHLSAAQVSILLKQVALIYYPRATVAALQGEAWLLFLQDTSKKLPLATIKEVLLESPFSPQSSHAIKPLFTLARAWIKQRRGKCLN
jgi:Tfp pilus assembly protein PilO